MYTFSISRQLWRLFENFARIQNSHRHANQPQEKPDQLKLKIFSQTKAARKTENPKIGASTTERRIQGELIFKLRNPPSPPKSTTRNKYLARLYSWHENSFEFALNVRSDRDKKDSRLSTVWFCFRWKKVLFPSRAESWTYFGISNWHTKPCSHAYSLSPKFQTREWSGIFSHRPHSGSKNDLVGKIDVRNQTNYHNWVIVVHSRSAWRGDCPRNSVCPSQRQVSEGQDWANQNGVSRTFCCLAEICYSHWFRICIRFWFTSQCRSQMFTE